MSLNIREGSDYKYKCCQTGFPAGLKLPFTLRFQATGDSNYKFAVSFRTSHSTIIRESTSQFENRIMARVYVGSLSSTMYKKLNFVSRN